jgi:hypothetical protein
MSDTHPTSTADLLASDTPEAEDDHDRDVDLLDGRSDEYRGRWNDIQNDFVDEPRRSVEQADGLVAEVITSLVERFSAERTRLEQQWTDGDVSTEELRTTLQHYRSFFHRLLDSPA